MSDVLDDYPLDFSRPELRALRDVLARAIFAPREIVDVVLAAGMNPGLVDFGGSAALQWGSVLVRARGEDRVRPLLDAVRAAQPPLGRRIDELLGPQPVLDPGTGAADDLSLPAGSGWRGFGAERIVVKGRDTLLGVSFLSTGVERSRSVCRVTATFGAEPAHGTAALVAPDLLLTNHHVLYDWDGDGSRADVVEAWFDYELDAAGTSRQPTVVPCAADTIAGDRDSDWAVVRLAAAPPPTSAVLALGGAAAPRTDDYVFIIQHPEGGPKMIGLSHNIVRYVDSDVLQYWTDTKAGSSGSPVFNTRWQVVGLHHRWVDAPDDDGMAYRNQGRRIEPVLAGLAARGIEVGP
jgi:V8-like Glu-specific endopeptidase